MRYVAVQSLNWGDDTIGPGDPVPADEPGRDYAGMLHRGEIREADESAGGSDAELRKELKALRKERDELKALADGPHLTPTDEEREVLIAKGMDGGFTLAELDAALAAGEDTEEASETAGDTEVDLPEGVTDLGAGWYELPDGNKVRGREALAEALKAEQ